MSQKRRNSTARALRPSSVKNQFDAVQSQLRALVPIPSQESSPSHTHPLPVGLRADFDRLLGSLRLLQKQLRKKAESDPMVRPLLERYIRGHNRLKDGLRAVSEECEGVRALTALVDSLKSVCEAAQQQVKLDESSAQKVEAPAGLKNRIQSRNLRTQISDTLDNDRRDLDTLES